MTASRLDALARQSLGWMRHVFRAQLRSLPTFLRPGEEVVRLAAAHGGLLGGTWLLAATAQRVLLIDQPMLRSPRCESFDYASLTSITVDAAGREIAFVSASGVRTLKLGPDFGAANEIVALATGAIGTDRIARAPAGAADARGMRNSLVRVLVVSCVFVGGLALSLAGTRSTDVHPPRDQAPIGQLTAGQCLDTMAVEVSCQSSGALFAVLRAQKRGLRPCPDESADVEELMMIAGVARRELARWCVAFSTRQTP